MNMVIILKERSLYLELLKAKIKSQMINNNKNNWINAHKDGSRVKSTKTWNEVALDL